MRALFWLTYKDLARFFADRQGALMTVMVPVVLGAFFGMLFSPRATATRVDLLVADEDGSPAVRELVTRIEANDSLAVTELPFAEAESEVEAGEAPLLLVIPAGTGGSLRASGLFLGGDRPAIRLVYDPSEEVQANLAEGLLTQIMMEQATKGLADPTSMKAMFLDVKESLAAEEASDPEMEAFVDKGLELADARERSDEPSDAASTERGLRPPVTIDKIAATVSGPATGYNSFSQNFAGMLVMFLMFMAQGEAKRLHAERELGSLTRLRMSRARPWQILIATGASVAIIALIASAIVYATGMVAFGVRVEGSWAGFVAVVIAQALFVGGFALLLAGLGRTEQQIGSVGSFVVLVLAFAGGATVPSFMMPDWLRLGSHALPTYWATRGLSAMTWRGLPPSHALLPTVMLVGFAVLFSVVGMRRFRWD